MSDLISIIIPIYNSKKYLGTCIESIIKQSYQNLEILLINDGSTDGSADLCDMYAAQDSRIKVIHKQNGGVSSARNKGLASAQGKYITFVDSDDFVDPGYVFEMHANIIEHNSDLAFCKYAKIVDSKTIYIEEPIPSCLKVNLQNPAFVRFIHRFFDYKQNIFGSSCRLLFKKELAKSLCFDSDIKTCEDLIFLVNLMLEAKRISCVNKHLYFYRIMPTSASHSYKPDFLNNQIALYNNLQRFFALFKDKESKKTFQVYSALLCYYVFSNALVHQKPDWKNQIQQARKSVLYNYFSLTNGVQLFGIKLKAKYFFVWFLVKTGLI